MTTPQDRQAEAKWADDLRAAEQETVAALHEAGRFTVAAYAQSVYAGLGDDPTLQARESAAIDQLSADELRVCSGLGLLPSEYIAGRSLI